MTVSTTRSPVAELLDSFTDAPDDRLPEQFDRLVAAVWSADGPTELALPVTPALVGLINEVDDTRKGYLAVLLGLLAQTEFPATDGPLFTAVREGLDSYLALLARGGRESPLTITLLYLLAHFPGDRTRILAAAEPLGLDRHDATRLERCVRELDLNAPDLGRCWPSPAVWHLDDEEQGFDQEWIRQLTPEQLITNWNNDTRTVLAYAGQRAYWAARYGTPQETSYPVPDGSGRPSDALAPTGATFADRDASLRCPSCHDALDFAADSARCAGCSTTYPIAGGLLDLTAGVSDSDTEDSDDATADLLAKLAEMPSMGLYYESVLRPAFLRVAGLNWGDQVTPGTEDAYLAEHIDPTTGPVLDLACGAGRWTTVVAETVGSDRLLAQDMGAPMLTAMRKRLPQVPAVMASALDLPYEDASLGAINCWNALQAFPEEAGLAIAEIGRCLRPGGTFTLMTFRWADDPIDRYFQATHHFPSRPPGMLLFTLDEVKQWLADAGLVVRHESGPGSFVFITAERATVGGRR